MRKLVIMAVDDRHVELKEDITGQIRKNLTSAE